MEVNGTTYKDETPREVVDVLETYRAARERGEDPPRLRVHYGDTETGQDWGDVYDVEGYIGRSTGTVKVPLMISNSRSLGGPAMLDHCIVRIRFADRSRGGDLYRHPNYKPPTSDGLSGPALEQYERDYERHFA